MSKPKDGVVAEYLGIRPVVRPLDKRPYAFSCKADGRTKSSFAPACDINSIVSSAQRNRVSLRDLDPRAYGDVSAVPNLQASLAIVEKAQGLFASMPSVVRSRFANDPLKMISFLRDKNNHDEAVKLGLLVPPVVKEPVAPISVPEAKS
nr:MAG: internal scaffolding protein [Microviridae sp.]